MSLMPHVLYGFGLFWCWFQVFVKPESKVPSCQSWSSESESHILIFGLRLNMDKVDKVDKKKKDMG